MAVVKRSILGLSILLIMPTLILLSGWQWKPQGNSFLLQIMYFFSETVRFPWGVLSSILLSIWVVSCLRLTRLISILLALLLILTIAIGQVFNSLIKNFVEEPRPFIVWLAHVNNVPSQKIYRLDASTRLRLLSSSNKKVNFPVWLKKIWAQEKAYSFPSGHTLFVSTWIIFYFFLLSRCYLTLFFITFWGIGVMGSRLLLGMHWPVDLIASVIVSWFLVMLVIQVLFRWFRTNFSFLLY